MSSNIHFSRTITKKGYKDELMDPKFWHQRWADNEIGFHRNDVNPLLLTYFEKLSLRPGARIFVPLCGKTLDIAWLLSKGFRVVGAELSALAIDQLFSELGMKPKITDLQHFQRYEGKKIQIFVGDIFDMSRELLEAVDAVYDRAALVAFPRDLRTRYAKQVMTITKLAPQLILCFEYDQTVVEGPPFSVPAQEIHEHFGNNYDLTELTRVPLFGGLKGKCPALETAWLLKAPKN